MQLPGIIANHDGTNSNKCDLGGSIGIMSLDQQAGPENNISSARFIMI